jgi:hypothetical protein
MKTKLTFLFIAALYASLNAQEKFIKSGFQFNIGLNTEINRWDESLGELGAGSNNANTDTTGYTFRLTNGVGKIIQLNYLRNLNKKLTWRVGADFTQRLIKTTQGFSNTGKISSNNVGFNASIIAPLNLNEYTKVLFQLGVESQLLLAFDEILLQKSATLLNLPPFGSLTNEAELRFKQNSSFALNMLMGVEWISEITENLIISTCLRYRAPLTQNYIFENKTKIDNPIFPIETTVSSSSFNKQSVQGTIGIIYILHKKKTKLSS